MKLYVVSHEVNSYGEYISSVSGVFNSPKKALDYISKKRNKSSMVIEEFELNTSKRNFIINYSEYIKFEKSKKKEKKNASKRD